MSPLLEKLSFENKNITLLGDFNINLLNHDQDNLTSEFINLITTGSLLPTITKPTRVTSRSKTLIDNIFINDTSDNLVSGNITTSISDHMAQFLLKTTTYPAMPKKSPLVYKRNYKNFSKEHFLLDILEVNWDAHLFSQHNDVNDAIQKFCDIINTLLDRHAPLKRVPRKNQANKLKPWITMGLITSINKKHFLYKKLIITKDHILREILLNSFKNYRNLLTSLVRKSKTNYFKQYFEENKKNLKSVWNGIKSIINTSKNTNGPPSMLNINSKTITDPNLIADSFNSYFGTIAQKIKNNIKQSNKCFSDFLNSPNTKSFFISPTNKDEVSDTIKKLNNNKSVGPMSIPSTILKEIAPTISEPLSKIFNLSFETGLFPTCLKTANVIPVHKKESKLNTNNYRPISLLSNIGKMIEKLMYSRLFSFLNNSNALYQLQFGFRNNHSTNHALVQITEDIREAIDSDNFACGVFIDLQKAFDTVEHSILLKKLNYYGIRGLTNNWFRSYITNRSQHVTIQNKTSLDTNIIHGVPQGSVLGPLLFLIYINDLHTTIAHSKTYHFADDTSLIYSNKSLKKINKHVNHDLKLLYEWLKANKISLNTKKTEIMLFRSKNKIINKHLNFRLSGTKINLSKTVKYLGIILDEHLTWDPHLKILSAKVSRATGMLAKIRHYVPTTVLYNIYYAILQSHLTYCCQIWGQNKSHPFIKLSNLQSRALKIICFKTQQNQINPLYINAKILKLEDYISLMNCLFAFDQTNDNLPLTFHNFFQQQNDTHHYCTRGSAQGQLVPPQVRTTKYGSNSIKSKSVLIWNQLKIKLKANINEITRPKLYQTIKQYYLNSYA